MKKATYHSPGGLPKTYDCQPGEAPGTVNLLNDKGKIIVSNLPLIAADADSVPLRGHAVLVEEDREKPRQPKKKEATASPVSEPSTPEPLNSSTHSL